MADRADVVVVGGGAVGCAVAYFLSREGAQVVVLDKDAIGSGASAHATGSLGTFSRDIVPGPYFTLIAESTRLTRSLAPSLEEETGIDLLYQEQPSLRVAFGEEDARQLRERIPWQQAELGQRVQWLAGEEVRALEPRASSSVVGAVYVESEIQVDSYRLTLALAHAAERRGAEVRQREVVGLEREGSRVTGVVLRKGRISCREVVLAMGVDSPSASPWLGFPLPVKPLKGQSVRMQYGGSPLGHLFGGFRQGHLLSRGDGLVSAGSTEEDVGLDTRLTEEGRLWVLGWALSVMPCLEEARVVQQLAGLRPLSADNMPIIGPVPGWEGVYLATGHGRKGIHLSLVTGRMVADLILRGGTSLPLEPFLPLRFAGWKGEP